MTQAVRHKISVGIYSLPTPSKKFYYYCDRYFHLDSIIGLYESVVNKDGCVIITGESSHFYTFSAEDEKLLGKINVKVARRHNKGGQSSVRFSRLRDQDIEAYITKVYEKCVLYFTQQGSPSVQSLLIIGPAEKKHMLYERLKASSLRSAIKKPITSDGDVESSLVKARAGLVDMDWETERAVKTEFDDYLRQNPDRLIFGEGNVLMGLEEDMVQKIYLSTSKYTEHKSLLKRYVNSEQLSIVNDSWIEDYCSIIGLRWY